MNYKIVVDSCCDLTEELKADSHFQSIPLTLHVGDIQITDDEIRMHALSHFQGLLSIGGRSADMETKRTPVQHGAKCNFYNRFVIDDQYLLHKFLPLLR